MKRLGPIILAGVAILSAEGPKGSADSVRSVMAAETALREVPLREVIFAATGHQVLSMNPDGDATDRECRDHISRAAAGIVNFLNGNENPIKGLRRINEASKHVEDKLVSLLHGGDFSCAYCTTPKGAAQRSGYPDLMITHLPSGKIFYLDPKLYESTSRTSTLRTFYYEPKTLTGKINAEGCHLLLGFAHDGRDGAWHFTAWDLVDLYGFSVRLKAEFHGSNRDLYRDELIIGSSEKK